MLRFRLDDHTGRLGQVVSVFDPSGNLLAAIYAEENKIRIFSKYLDEHSISRPDPIVIEVMLP
jgi:hypothetical protein